MLVFAILLIYMPAIVNATNPYQLTASIQNFTDSTKTVSISGIKTATNFVNYSANETSDLKVYKITIASNYDKINIIFDGSGIWNTKVLQQTEKKVTTRVDSIEKDSYSFTGFTDDEKAQILSFADEGAYDYFVAIYGKVTESGSGRNKTTAASDPAILIIQWEKADNVNKASLQTALAAVPTTGYYKTENNDKWNGKEYSDTGFWAEMQAVVAEAQAVYDNDDATQDEVDAATASLNQTDTNSALSKAIAKLIPSARINATVLYESSNRYPYYQGTEVVLLTEPIGDGNDAVEDNTSPTSWAAYQSALASANAELSLLYDAEGNPTDYNASDGAAATNAARAETALTAAIAGLDRITSPTLAGWAYDGLGNLLKRLYGPERLNEQDYTPESWAVFAAARTAAEEFYSTHSAPEEGIGTKEAASYGLAYNAFLSACTETLVSRGNTATVTLDITDNHALLNGLAPSPYAGTYRITLPAAEATAQKALEEVFGEDFEINDIWRQSNDFGIGFYLNDIYYTRFFLVGESRLNAVYISATRIDYSKLRLRDGDRLVLALMKLPTEENLSGAAMALSDVEILPDLQYLRVAATNGEEDLVNATANEIITLHAGVLTSSPTVYSGAMPGRANVHIYISDAFKTEAEALGAVSFHDSGIVTDIAGNASLRLYSAKGASQGWYALTFCADGDKGGLVNGPNLLIHVTDPADLSGLRAEMKARLGELRNAYEDEYYRQNQLNELETLYTNALSDIDAAADSGSIFAVYTQAEEAMAAIQGAVVSELECGLDNIRFLLSILPTVEDARQGRFFTMDLQSLTALQQVYAAMSDFQRSQLLTSENELLDYYLTVDPADVTAADRAVTVSLRAFDAETGLELTLGRDEGEVPLQIKNFTSGRQSGLMQDAEGMYAFADDTAWSYETYMKITDAAKTTVTLPAGFHTATLYWGFPYIDAAMVSGGSADDYVTNGYEIVSVELNVDGHYFAEPTASAGAKWGRSSNPITAPREDVVITVYVRQAEEEAPDTYLEQLIAAFNTYQKSDYSGENWKALVNAYSAGVSAIKQAQNNGDKQTALDAAILAMSEVETLPASQGEYIPGWGPDDAFNAGKKVGAVTLTAENTTFPDGAFKGVFIKKENYPIGENDNMMTVILRALADEHFDWDGTGGNAFNIGYLSRIIKDGQSLGQFSGDSGSGWMGTLNDFLVNEGFPGFSTANGSLKDGDMIALLFTQNLGEDLGGTWGNLNTTLKSLEVSVGEIVPGFTSGESGKQYDLALLIPSDSASLMLKPTASNRNFLVKTFLNEKVVDNTEGSSYYRRTESIPVNSGDVVYIGVGEYAWPSMNKQAGNNELYYATWYALHVITADDGAEYVNELITALPAVKNVSSSNYQAVQKQIDAIDAVIAVLSASEKARVNTATLNSVREIVEGYEAIMALKTELKNLPANVSEADRAAVNTAKVHYNALTAAQKNLLTVAETNKLLKAVNTLTLIDELKAIDANKDFDSTVANTETEVMTALRTWLKGQTSAKDEDVIITVTSFTDANSSRDGSYTATVSFTLRSNDSQAAAATQEKTFSGTIWCSSDAGVSKIEVSGVAATGSDTSWAATLPYGTDLATVTAADFNITRADGAEVTAVPDTKDNGETWTFTVTAQDGITSERYTVTLSVSKVNVTVLDSWVYYVSEDTQPVKLDASAVVGLQKAVNADALLLDEGTEEAFLWVEARQKSNDVFTITPVYAPVGKDGKANPADYLIGTYTLTLPVPGTEYAKVLFDGKYLDAAGSDSGITFAAKAGDYTLIPDAHIAIVTFHEFDGTNNRQIVFYRGDAGNDLPAASKSGAAFKGWYAKADCTGDKFTTVSATLPTDLYPLWSYGVKTEEVGDIEDRVEVSAIVQGDVATITVESKKPCAVIVEKPDGSFERLEAFDNGDGSCNFVQKDYDADMVFYVATLGDYDENGVLELADLTAANLTIIGDVDLEPLSAFIMGAKDGKLRTVDLAKLFLHLARNDVEW